MQLNPSFHVLDRPATCRTRPCALPRPARPGRGEARPWSCSEKSPDQGKCSFPSRAASGSAAPGTSSSPRGVTWFDFGVRLLPGFMSLVSVRKHSQLRTSSVCLSMAPFRAFVCRRNQHILRPRTLAAPAQRSPELSCFRAVQCSLIPISAELALNLDGHKPSGINFDAKERPGAAGTAF